MVLLDDMSYVKQQSVGFSGVLFALVVVDIHKSDVATRSVMGFVSVPSKWYPWALLVLLQVRSPRALTPVAPVPSPPPPALGPAPDSSPPATLTSSACLFERPASRCSSLTCLFSGTSVGSFSARGRPAGGSGGCCPRWRSRRKWRHGRCCARSWRTSGLFCARRMHAGVRLSRMHGGGCGAGRSRWDIGARVCWQGWRRSQGGGGRGGRARARETRGRALVHSVGESEARVRSAVQTRLATPPSHGPSAPPSAPSPPSTPPAPASNNSS